VAAATNTTDNEDEGGDDDAAYDRVLGPKQDLIVDLCRGGTAEEREYIREFSFRCVIADEAHLLKKMGGSFQTMIAKVRAQHKHLCTATPMLNKVIDIVGLIFILEELICYNAPDNGVVFDSRLNDVPSVTLFDPSWNPYKPYSATTPGTKGERERPPVWSKSSPKESRSLCQRVFDRSGRRARLWHLNHRLVHTFGTENFWSAG